MFAGLEFGQECLVDLVVLGQLCVKRVLVCHEGVAADLATKTARQRRINYNLMVPSRAVMMGRRGKRTS